MTNSKSIKFNTFDYIIIAITLMLLIYTWCYVIIEYNYLPETIAVHFDGNGNPNGYNNKSSIWLAPIFFTILSIALIFGAKNPEQLNFPNKKLSEKEKIAGSKTALFSGLLLSCILFLIVHSMIKNSIISEENPTSWVIPVIFVLIALFLIAVFYYQFKYSKK